MSKILDYKIIVFLIVIVAFLSQLDALYPTIMEARNFVSAREMLANNDFIFTKLNGIPRYEKPPFPTWITAFMGYFFGSDNLLALRIPNAIISIFMMVYLYKIILFFTRNKRLGFYAVLIASTSYLIIYVGKSNTWDVFCYAFAFMAIYHFLQAITYNKTKNWLYVSLLMACSILSKGPLAILIMFVPFVVSYFLILDRKLIQKIDFKKAVIFGIIAISIGFSWYAIVYFNDTETFKYIAEKEALARVNRGVKPFHRYFSFFAQTGIWIIPAFLSLLYPLFRKKIGYKKEYKFFLLWVLGSVFLLSLFPEKKERYLFPVLFPLAVLISFVIEVFITKFKEYKWIKTSVYTHFIIFIVLSVVVAIIPYFIIEEVNILTYIFTFLMIILNGILAFYTFKTKFEDAFATQIIMTLVILVIGISVLKPAIFNNEEYTELKTITNKFPNLELYSIESYSPELWFTYQKIIPDFVPSEFKKQTFKTDSILLLQIKSSEFNIKELEEFDIKRIGVVDENLEKEDANNYSNRKQGNVFLLVKKQLKIAEN